MGRYALLATAILLSAAANASPAGWNAETFANQSTIKLRTTNPGEGEYWFPVWVVVVDGQPYVRLGSRATSRVEGNTTAPYLGVEVGGQRFDKVRAIPAPESAARVGAAMAQKYWSDLVVRYMSHPLTLRLVPE